MHTPRTVHRVQQPRHRSCSVSASTSAPLPREYELQEPSAEGRAIDPDAVERMFDATLGTHILRAISNTSGAASLVHPPSGPGLIRPGGGTASASTGPRSATTPPPSPCAAIPRRSRSSPRTARSGVHGRS